MLAKDLALVLFEKEIRWHAFFDGRYELFHPMPMGFGDRAYFRFVA